MAIPAQVTSPEDMRKTQVPAILPVMPVRDLVALPTNVFPLRVQREANVRLLDDVLVADKLLCLVAQKDPAVEQPKPDDLYSVGTAAVVVQMIRAPDGSMRVLIQCLARVRLQEFVQQTPYLKARVIELESVAEDSIEIEAIKRAVLEQFRKILSLHPHLSEELYTVAASIEDPSMLADFIPPYIDIDREERQKLLEQLDVKKRLELLAQHLKKELEVLELTSKIQSDVTTEMTKSQKEFLLRKQLEAIQKELGEGTDREIQELKEKIEKANMPPEAKKQAEHEVERLAMMHPSAAEYSVVRTYLDWLVEMPWSVQTEDRLDIKSASGILDRDHYGLEKIKERVLEYLSVRKLKKDSKGPILCFVGPPGTGKTSIGRSIAEALGRKFVRMSLGGIRDEAEIRGHRRTYVGALPGRIIQGIRRVGTRNPVFMLDEVDKLGADFRGDPSSALLEVLDPEQNSAFSDHYLEVPFDLSNVTFITTANVLFTVPPALRDRMEVIEFPGYTEEEKLEIARRHLMPKQLREHGLDAGKVTITDEALKRIIRDYTREAGLRNLEREIANVLRKVTRKIAEGKARSASVLPKDLHGYLGPAKYVPEVKERVGRPGVATGLYWTPAGGDIVFVESTRMPGKKGFILTGQLGDVMRESAQAALSYIRSRAKDLGIPEDFFDSSDIHVHVPEGAIAKDGPSAGLTMVASLASLLMGTPVRPDVAMTGEITLRGNVLPVGGIKEKVLGARRAGIRHVLLPRKNEKDLEEVPRAVRKEMKFHLVEDVGEALKLALHPKRKKTGSGAAKKPRPRVVATRT